jgi:hypothetical protein
LHGLRLVIAARRAGGSMLLCVPAHLPRSQAQTLARVTHHRISKILYGPSSFVFAFFYCCCCFRIFLCKSTSSSECRSFFRSGIRTSAARLFARKLSRTFASLVLARGHMAGYDKCHANAGRARAAFGPEKHFSVLQRSGRGAGFKSTQSLYSDKVSQNLKL